MDVWSKEICRKSEVRKLENCVKAILYTYPKLKSIERDYGEHIENRAVLSYKFKGAAESLVEELAEDVLRRRKLAKLKEELDKLFAGFSEEERLLLQIRYFGKIRKAKEEGRTRKREDFPEAKAAEEKREIIGQLNWSERSYYRKQNKLFKKIVAAFVRLGLTKEVLEKDYLQYEFLRVVYRFLRSGDRKIIAPRERALVRLFR